MLKSLATAWVPRAALWVVPTVAVGLCAATLYGPARLILQSRPGNGVTRETATAFRAAVAGVVGPDDVVLVDLDQNTRLFCSSTYWLDPYVFSPFSTGPYAREIVERILQSGRKVVVLSGSATLSDRSEELLRWAGGTWDVRRLAVLNFSSRVYVWQVALRPPVQPLRSDAQRHSH